MTRVRHGCSPKADRLGVLRPAPLEQRHVVATMVDHGQQTPPVLGHDLDNGEPARLRSARIDRIEAAFRRSDRCAGSRKLGMNSDRFGSVAVPAPCTGTTQISRSPNRLASTLWVKPLCLCWANTGTEPRPGQPSRDRSESAISDRKPQNGIALCRGGAPLPVTAFRNILSNHSQQHQNKPKIVRKHPLEGAANSAQETLTPATLNASVASRAERKFTT